MHDPSLQEFQEKLLEFEKTVMIPLVGLKGKTLFVSTRAGKLYKEYRNIFKSIVDSDEEFAIDYYGYIKKSKGLLQSIDMQSLDSPGVQIAAVKTKVIYFASLRIEDVLNVSPEMVALFPVIKKQILKYRGFKKDN